MHESLGQEVYQMSAKAFFNYKNCLNLRLFNLKIDFVSLKIFNNNFKNN